MSLKDSCKALVAVSLLTVAVALPAYAQDTAAAPAAPAATDATAAAAPVAAPDALPSLPDADPALAAPEPQDPVDNPYGLSALWAQGDAVARLVLILLLIMSVATWSIMILQMIEQQTVDTTATEAKAKIRTTKNP